MRSPNYRTGSSPASLMSWPADGSIMIGIPKKSRHWGHARGILIGCLRGRERTGQINRLDAKRGETIPNPAGGAV
jgi:hypothetical protein